MREDLQMYVKLCEYNHKVSSFDISTNVCSAMRGTKEKRACNSLRKWAEEKYSKYLKINVY